MDIGGRKKDATVETRNEQGRVQDVTVKQSWIWRVEHKM